MAGTMANTGFARNRFHSTADVLKVGLIGCGGRGTGAAAQALNADPNVLLTAMGDAFSDRLEESYSALMEEVPQKVKVGKTEKFVGFDAPHEFLVGYGLDHAENFRHLPYIASLQ